VQIVKAQSVPETADMPARNGQSWIATKMTVYT
jgi:hypothetical protein